MQEICITDYTYSAGQLIQTSQSCFKPLQVLTFDLIIISISLFVAYIVFKSIVNKNIL